MELEFLGTGDARRVPVYGCRCTACERALAKPEHRRLACSARVVSGGTTVLLDAGRTDLCESFAPGSIDAFVLTHYHMDHVMGLFHVRWGAGHTIPVYGPDDPKGCDDLFKHPGILDFQPSPEAFVPFVIGELTFTPLPLNHSRPVFGYCIEADGKRIAYLTDTVWLPDDTLEWLTSHTPDVMVVDCSMPPKPEPPRNHNDLTLALKLSELIQPDATYLTHIGHQLDEYLLNSESLPSRVFVAEDGKVLK